MTAEKVFSLVVDDFCVQYLSTEDADHFFKAFTPKYLITVDMAETVCIGINLEWDYMHRIVTLSMPSYVRKYLHRFQHILRCGKEYSPHNCAPIQYGQKVQYADPLDVADYLSEKETNLVQQVCENFLYYAIAIDNNILPELIDIYSEQYKATKNTEKQVAKG